MFTGLVETIGVLREIRPGRGMTRVGIESDLPMAEMSDGESVAVDGVCLTVVERRGRVFRSDAIAETLRCTTLGSLRTGAKVNLERALRVGDRLGGHLVQGHVDATVRVLDVHSRGGDHRVRLSRPPDVARYVAFKGSVALNGVSLTVSAVSPGDFEVALIPETLQRTNLAALRAGAEVNLEVDLLARYLETMLDGRPGDEGRRSDA